ncbi:DUF1573 domain-containing protein [Pedobacter sp. MC2016-24]|uniref:DUF1573 domain-containing protein n=1 Tax=Pedobacter sp. MC2016-24 TaxID=2780090 RepID=UPI0018817DCF|nr:DUF1573 domain-containing protein [Pedobacter sp. MC2016-24]
MLCLGNNPQIFKVQPDCHCSTTKWSKLPVFSGDSSEVRILYKPKVLGPTTQRFYLYTSAQKDPEVLAFRAVVVNTLK